MVSVADLEDLAKLETNYDETLQETSQGGKVVSLTEYNERQELVEEVRESSEEALARLDGRRPELREQRGWAYRESVEGLPNRGSP